MRAKKDTEKSLERETGQANGWGSMGSCFVSFQDREEYFSEGKGGSYGKRLIYSSSSNTNRKAKAGV